MEVSIDEPLNVDWDGNELLLSDILGTDDDTVSVDIESEAEKRMLLEAVEKLDEREKLIMELRFGLNNRPEKTQKEVADMIGISQSYISRLEKRIIKKAQKGNGKPVQLGVLLLFSCQLPPLHILVRPLPLSQCRRHSLHLRRKDTSLSH